MFLNEAANDHAFQRLLESNDAYSIILENMNIIRAAEASGGKYNVVITEDDQSKIEKAAEAYVNEVRGEIDKHTDNAEKLRKEAKIWAWITLGTYVAGMLIGAGAGVSIILAVLACLAWCFTIVAAIVAMVKADKARKEIMKLGTIKRKLQVHRERSKDHTVQDKIDDLIFKIKGIEDKVYDDTSDSRTVNHDVGR